MYLLLHSRRSHISCAATRQGDLECFQRDDETPVPGCDGLGVETYDYCYDPNDA